MALHWPLRRTLLLTTLLRLLAPRVALRGGLLAGRTLRRLTLAVVILPLRLLLLARRSLRRLARRLGRATLLPLARRPFPLRRGRRALGGLGLLPTPLRRLPLGAIVVAARGLLGVAPGPALFTVLLLIPLALPGFGLP